MEKIADKHYKEVKRIKENVEDSRDYNRNNNERYHRYRSFIFESTVSTDDRNTLTAADKPVVEVNVLEAFLSRLWGEFSKQVPNLVVRGLNDNTSPEQIDLIEGILRSILGGSEYENKANHVYRDTMSGGFSGWRVYTEYESDDSMNQVIRIDKVFDPTLVGFDPLARHPSKCDGEYIYELVPKYREELEDEYPELDFSQLKMDVLFNDDQFRWSYRQDNKEIYYVADYYEKKHKYVVMYEISDPTNPDLTHSVTREEYKRIVENWDSISEPPQVITEAKRKFTTIVRYKFINDVLLERPEDIDYDYFPIIFVDGNSAIIRGKQITRPYAFNAMDAQRIKNLAASNIVNDLENTRQTDVMIAKESWPQEPEFEEAWLNPQKTQAALVYNSVGPDGQPLPKPDILPRSQVNTAFMQIFDMQDKTMQTILGSYDAQLGISQNQLSGVAIVEGATQSNNAAMPYIINYLASLGQLAKVIVNLIPKYYKTLRTVPVTLPNGKHEYRLVNDSSSENPIMMNFDKNDLDVVVTAGANFDIQRNQAVTTMLELMKGSETFRGMMETRGLPLLLDNIDIRGKEQLKDMTEEFMQEQKQKSSQKQDPQQQMMQAQMQIEMQKLQLQAQKQKNDMMIQSEKLKQSNNELMQSQYRMISDVENDRALTMVRMREAKNTEDRTQAEIMMNMFDHQLQRLKHDLSFAKHSHDMREVSDDSYIS